MVCRYLLIVFTASMLFSACRSELPVPETPEANVSGRPDFSLRYERGNGNFFEPLQRTTFELQKNNLRVTFKYPKNVKRVVQNTLSDDQLRYLWQKLSKLDLNGLAESANSLHERCRHRETDIPYSALEVSINGNSMTIANDFDEKRCPELEDFERFMDELPSLLGNPTPPPKK
jgi:hypothetical protein